MARKVVVVDDEKPIADILEFNLKKEGYLVEMVWKYVVKCVKNMKCRLSC